MENYIEINGIGYEYFETDGIIEVDKDGRILGHICANPEDWDLILNGADPIKEGWEDGLGNPLSIEGWGDYYKGEIEE